MDAEKEISIKGQHVDSPSDLSINSVKAFEQIYKKHFKRLFSIAYGILKHQEKAEGIVHDVFLSVWGRRKKIRLTESLEGYLVKAVKLAVMEHMRKVTTRRRHLEIISARPEARDNIVELEFGAAELQERINLLVDQLPPQSQKVYRLSREEGKNNKEISSQMLIAEKTVESHLTKALSYLRSNLSEYNL